MNIVLKCINMFSVMPLANNLYTYNNYKAALNYSATKRIICQTCKHAAMNCWTETVHVARDGLVQACTRFSFTYFLYLFYFYFLNVRFISFSSSLLRLTGQIVWPCSLSPSCPPPFSDRIEQRHQNDEFGSSWMWTWSSNISKNLLLPLLREMLRCGVV